MIKHIKDELTELLLKIGETNLNQSDLFTEEKPSLFLPEGRTIYLEGDYYYIVGVERGKINSEKKFDNKEDILYYLLQSYVTRIASKMHGLMLMEILTVMIPFFKKNKFAYLV